MTWLLRAGKEDREKEKDAKPKLLIDTDDCNNNAAAATIASSSSSSSSRPSDGAYAYEPQHPRNRSFTDSPATRTSTDSAAARFNSDMRRAISSGGRLKKKKAHVSPAVQALGKMDSFPIDLLPSPRAAVEPGDAATTGKGKRKWRKRVFSSDFFKPSGAGDKVNHNPEKNNGQPAIAAAVAAAAATPKTATLETIPPSPPAPSAVLTSGHAVTTNESRRSRCASSGTDANQVASTVESCLVNGIRPPEERESAGKVFNDVIGMADGKVGCTSKMTRAHRWRPPILALDMQVLAAADRVPVTTGHGYDLWIAVVLQGHVVGDIDFLGTSGPNTAGIGLDVGLLLDVSYELFSFSPFPVQS